MKTSPGKFHPAVHGRFRWSLGLAMVTLVTVALAAAFHLRRTSAPVSRITAPFVNSAPDVGIVRQNACGSPGLIYIFENIGSGAALFDYDNDGRLDIFINNAGTTKVEAGPPRRVQILPGPGTSLYRQLPDGQFEDVTEKAGVTWTAGARVWPSVTWKTTAIWISLSVLSAPIVSF